MGLVPQADVELALVTITSSDPPRELMRPIPTTPGYRCLEILVLNSTASWTLQSLCAKG